MTLELFRIIGLMISMPEGLEAEIRRELDAFEEGKQMRCVTRVERAGIEKGLGQSKKLGYRKGKADLLLWQIEKKIRHEAGQLGRPRVGAAESHALCTWSEHIVGATTLDPCVPRRTNICLARSTAPQSGVPGKQWRHWVR